MSSQHKPMYGCHGDVDSFVCIYPKIFKGHLRPNYIVQVFLPLTCQMNWLQSQFNKDVWYTLYGKE